MTGCHGDTEEVEEQVLGESGSKELQAEGTSNGKVLSQ